MWQAGATQSKAITFGISQGAVSKILKRHRERSVSTPKLRSDGPCKTRENRYLLRLCRDNHLKTASQLRTMWIRFTNTPVTTRFVNYRLLSAGYFARRPLRKPLFQQRHRQAEQHLNWRVGHWQHAVFGDKSRFLLYREDGRIRVLGQAREA